MVKKTRKEYVLLGAIILLLIISILIIWELLTANYPTHSDIFFMGVQCGVLIVVLLVSLVLIGLFLYRLRGETGVVGNILRLEGSEV